MTSCNELLRLANTVDPEELWRASGITQGEYTPEQRDRLMAAVNLRRYSKHSERIERLITDNYQLREHLSSISRDLDRVKRCKGWDSIPLSLHKGIEILFDSIEKARGGR